ncbi:nuclear pore complex protein Nup205 isoform X3 [Calypte anna]|uniref:nuclear pore complex protein Nup205 isoform X3 n=1 Tax=Calypte anna TaxID=9244 RepID=UPI0011C3EB78|nr:nuclear pore complex protein Nup205 isoform X3 [Calypte anna]
MAAPLAVNSAASLWGPYKDIWQTVMNAIWKRQPEAIHRLDQVLKKHKSDFISLFRNPPKNVQQHEKIQKASTEGVAVQGQQGTRLLPEQLIREAFILSDLFDIGELAAVELLLAGEHQQPHFPGLTRGLVAVLLYWDGKRCIANSLRTLIQSRQGKTWTLELSQELTSMTTRFTDDLMEQGLTQKILTLVSQIDLNNEFDKLQRERGLGSEKHRKEVSDLIKECRQSLAESLFVWTCQSSLSKDDTLILISYLEKVTVEADGSLDGVNLSLLMALLYCFDVSFLEQGTEDREDLMHRLPLLTERQYIATIHTRLQDSQPWKLPGLQATVRLAWALTLRGISQLSDVTALAEFTEADEAMAELAVADNVFLFLTESVVGSENFYQEEFYIRRIHNLVTDFLALMPMKVKQLRNRADEDARMIHMSIQMGNDPPISLRRDLEHLMLLIAELYKKDPFNLELALEYWCPSEPLQTSTIMGSYLGVAHQRPPQRQVVLSKFVRQMGDLLPSTIYIPYLKMLRGLASGPQCAHYCFSLLKVNGSSHVENIQGAGGSPVSWEHFFHSLMLYHEHLRKDLPSADSVQYRHLPLRGITQKEQDGLIAFLQLTTVIVNWSENARLALCEHPQWTPVVVILGLLQCSIPPILKAELLETLTAFGKSPEIAASLWQSLEYTQILQTVRSPGQRQAVGIEVELNEIESRCEEYPLTRAFCRLVSTLVESSFPSNLGAGLRPPGFDPYLQFLRDAVFLRFRTRAYRRAAEKWEVAEVVLEVFYKLLHDYEPQLEDFVDQYVELQGEEIIAYKPPGFNLMYHLLNESPMLELSLSLLEEGVKQLDTYAPFPGKKHLEKAVQYCLALLNLTLQKENLFMDLLRESHLSFIVTPLEQLLQGINPRTKKADHVVNIARYLYHGNSNPELAFESAKILCCISCNSNIQMKLVGDFTHDQSISQKLMAGFVECLDNEDAEELINPDEELEPEKRRARIHHETRIHILNLLITSLECSPPSLALYLLGYELKKPVSTTNLQDPGVLGCPRTCLHAILNILEKGTETRNGPTAVQESPHLAELCYQVIYQLCACSDTSGPTMRYLRTSQDFLFTQLQYLPFSIKEHEISTLNQMSWLMKTAAIEMRVTSLNRQRSHTQRLLHLLLDDMPVKPYLADGEGGMEDESRSVSGFLHFDTASKVRRKILSILDSIDFSQDIPEPLQLDFFDRVQIEQVIANCEHKNARGQVVCNVKYLHRVLVAEVNALQGMAAIGQRPLLMEVVCRDACDGHEIGRMLALALLDCIVSVDKQQQWLLYLSNSGYLKVLVDSLADDDLTLQSLLTPQPPLLKALFTYESKMAFLTRIAKSQQGALELLRSGVIVRLAQCQVYDMRPETDHQGMYGMRDPPVFIPAPVERYRQILLPALQLCQVILTSSMAQHLQAAGQVLQFLISHSDTIQAILRCQDVSVGSLQELASLTGIISKAALPGVLSELDIDVNEGTLMELQGHIGRFQRQCLGLLSRFGGSDRLRQFKLQDDNTEGDRVNRRDEIELAMQQICANVMEYCESLMLQSAPSFQHTVCLFTPSLSESTSRDGPRQDTQAPVVPYWHLPGLGIIVYLLKQSTSDFFSYYDSHRQSVNKLQNVEQLPPDEIKELCQSVMPAGVDKISTSQKYVLARRRLVKLINNRAKLLSLCSYIIETCLFILWRHLEHYLLHCTPSDSQDPLLTSRMSFKKGRLQDSFGSEPSLDFSSRLNRVSQHDIEQLQIEATNSFGESLQKKLLDIEGLYSKVRSRYTFIQALVRRIRGLLRISRT